MLPIRLLRRAATYPLLAVLLATGAVPAVASPGSGGPASAVVATSALAGRPLLVTNRDSATISVLTLHRGGTVTAVDISTPTGAAPRGLTLTPDGRVAFVANTLGDSISVYAVGPRGLLTPLGEVPTTNTGPFSIALTPDGRRLFVSHVGRSLAAYEVGPGATLRLLGTVPTAPFHVRSLTVTPDGRYLFATQGEPRLNEDGLLTGYAIGPDGTLTVRVPAVDVGQSTGTTSITPDGRYLIVPSEESQQISVFRVRPNGMVEPAVGSPFPIAAQPQATTVTPDGRYLYVTDLAGAVVWGYRLGRGGQLVPLPDAPYPTGQVPIAITTDPVGRHLLVTSFGSDDIAVYDIAAGGSLRPVAGSPFPTGGDGPAIRSTVLVPNQGPVAAFTARARPAGRPTGFDASGSTDPDGRIARYRWDFGDGSARTAGPLARHVYRHPGRYLVTLTVTDNEGCAARRVFTGQVVLCNGGPAATEARWLTVAG